MGCSLAKNIQEMEKEREREMGNDAALMDQPNRSAGPFSVGRIDRSTVPSEQFMFHRARVQNHIAQW